MITKILLFILIFILTLLYDNKNLKNKNVKKILYLVIIFSLTFIFSIREYIFSDFGTDYFEYKNWYNAISFNNITRLGYNNIGFKLIISLVKILFDNFLIFQFICGFIINALVLKFIEKESNDFGLSVLIYISFFLDITFNIVRQWIACAIFLYSFSFIKNKKIFKYILCCLFAMSFHSSAIFLVIMYPLLRKNDNFRKKEVIMLFAGIILFFFANTILNYVFTSDLFMMDLYSKYETYVGTASNYTSFIICAAILFLCNIFQEKLILSDEDKRKVIFLFVSMIFSLLSTTSILFARFSIYFMPSIILCIPLLLNLFKTKDKFFVRFVLCFLLMIVYVLG